MANVDLKSLFTSEKSYTVLQLLNVLIDEVGKSMVKTASINQDVDAGTLTVTITLSDDSVVTASTDLISLTDTEKSLISTLTSNVTATNEGMTFLKVVGFEGNETHKGNEIHNGYASFLGDENHAGTETHKGIIKTNEIDNLNGNAIVRYKDTEGKTVIGTSEKPTVLMGSTDRPYYSKDGSDFNGTELALKSDVPSSTPRYMHTETMRGWSSSQDDESAIIFVFSFISSTNTKVDTSVIGTALDKVLYALYTTHNVVDYVPILSEYNEGSNLSSVLLRAVRLKFTSSSILINYFSGNTYALTNHTLTSSTFVIGSTEDIVSEV